MNAVSGVAAVAAVCNDSMSWPEAFLGVGIAMTFAWFMVTMVKHM